MSMKVLIIGSGGREHCIAWKISKSDLVEKIYAIPGNPGIAELADCKNIEIKKENFSQIISFVQEKGIDFTIVGPEAPLVDGIVDVFDKKGLKIFGPDMKGAILEGSKVFTKDLCKKYEIPTPGSYVFKRSDRQKADNYLRKLKNDKFPIVIKADGLAAGKGVIIAQTREQALGTVEQCFIKNVFGSSGDSIVIEDFVKGFELSLMNLCDGQNIVPMVLAQDYKKIFDNDMGKNTGGMGSYSPVPYVSDDLYDKILNRIIYPTYDALLKEGIVYKGILYGGIIVEEGEPYLLEYNCRFGDPETQAILPRLNNDLLELLINCAGGKLSSQKLSWSSDRCVCVVIASKGYPESSSSGDVIKGLDDLKNNGGIIVFHAGTRYEESNIVTAGGRVLGAVSCAPSFKKARNKIYNAINKIEFDGMQYRKDIALRVEEE
jgi:phosphoribosylamine---glycine ligase